MGMREANAVDLRKIDMFASEHAFWVAAQGMLRYNIMV